MGIFATRTRRSTARPEAGGPLSDELLVALPPRFEAVGEALASGSGPSDACAVVGRELARDGVTLEETLDGLLQACRLVLGREPAYGEVREVAVAWGEATLAYLHQLSCEDPLTGLSSMAHVRSRLSELYRGQLREPGDLRDAWALVVVDRGQRPDVRPGALTQALHTSRLGDAARTVFNGSETIGRVGADRLVVLAARDARLGQRVGLLRRLLHPSEPAPELAPEPGTVRVWIEGLPATDDAAAALLDELSRS